VTLRQLRYFKAVAEHGSFSRAAENLHVSQPALSLQVHELEDAFGSPLLVREHHGVTLTVLGRQAHVQTLRILDEVLYLETMGKRFETGPFQITVGLVSTLAPYLLGGLVERLKSSSPRIVLDVLEAPGPELVSGLLAGRLDAALLCVPLGLMELDERELFEDRLVLAGRAERLDAFAALGDAARTVDLAQSDIGPLLTLAKGHCLGDQVLGACSMWRPQEAHRGAESLATLSALVASGAGLTLLPETAVLGEHAACSDLRFLRLPSPEPSRRIGLACRMVFQGETWIDPLADAASDAGQALVRTTREFLDGHVASPSITGAAVHADEGDRR